MATKLNNNHLSTIMENCKEYYIFDTYIALAYISSNIDGKYLIQTFTENKSDIINAVKKYVDVAYKTVSNCIDKLITLNILEFSLSLNAWVLIDMEKMTELKSDYIKEEKIKGYTKIRSFLLTKEFLKMKFRVKRLIIYMLQLLDSKASKLYKDFTLNLLKNNSSWMKVLRTTNKYYARETINYIVEKYSSFFEDKSDEIRKNTLAPNKIISFKFCLKLKKINDIKKGKEVLEDIKKYNLREYNLIKQRMKYFNINLSSVEIVNLIRSVSTLNEWFIKERVIQIILNKYIAIQIHKSREKIKSLPAYASAVVKAVIQEYKESKECKANIDRENKVKEESIIENTLKQYKAC